MRILATGAGIAAILLISFSCKTTKQSSTLTSEESRRTEERVTLSQVSRRLETEYLGDSLIGRMPLPYTVPRAVSFQVESGGINFDISLQDSTLDFKAVAKPVARSKLSWGDSTYQEEKLEDIQSATTEETSTKKKTGFPWWLWPLLAVVAALAILIKINRIKIF
jgi:hypothetical protein